MQIGSLEIERALQADKYFEIETEQKRPIGRSTCVQTYFRVTSSAGTWASGGNFGLL